jgi:hypothetical protein
MKKYTVSVSETINHSYSVEADSVEEALIAYDKFTSEDLERLDLDGSNSWDQPWDVVEEHD